MSCLPLTVINLSVKGEETGASMRTADYSDIDSIIEYATEAQARMLQAIQKHGNPCRASKAEGFAKATAQVALKSVRKKAARHAPVNEPFEIGVPTGYVRGKVTIQRNADGQIVQSWERQHPEIENLEAIIDRMEQRLFDFPRFEPLPAPAGPLPEKLTNQISIFDLHVGETVAAVDETEAWSIKHAKRYAVEGTANLIRRLTPAKRLVLVFGGDILHYDGPLPVTPTSRHVLHSDGDVESMADAGLEIAEACIKQALESHEEVHLIWAEGNHDYLGSMWMRKMFERLYANEPRLTVHAPKDRTAFFGLLFGKNLIGVHHGHGVKPDQLPGAFANLFRKLWGAAENAYAHCGHQHHEYSRDKDGMKVLQHPALPPSDAYAKSKALIAQRGMLGHTYHDDAGMIDQLSFRPVMLDI
jgi:hypothetical protein